jgi:hypothetical protein
MNMTNIEQRIENLKRFIEIDKATINEMIDQGFDKEVIETEQETLKVNEEELERLLLIDDKLQAYVDKTPIYLDDI